MSTPVYVICDMIHDRRRLMGSRISHPAYGPYTERKGPSCETKHTMYVCDVLVKTICLDGVSNSAL